MTRRPTEPHPPLAQLLAKPHVRYRIAAAFVDSRYPDRACVQCGCTYRGPSLHCSPECAALPDITGDVRGDSPTRI